VLDEVLRVSPLEGRFLDRIGLGRVVPQEVEVSVHPGESTELGFAAILLLDPHEVGVEAAALEGPRGAAVDPS
jgi:hypothetical protein